MSRPMTMRDKPNYNYPKTYVKYKIVFSKTLSGFMCFRNVKTNNVVIGQEYNRGPFEGVKKMNFVSEKEIVTSGTWSLGFCSVTHGKKCSR